MQAMDEGFERGREGRIFFKHVTVFGDARLRGGSVFARNERVVNFAQIRGDDIGGRGDTSRGVVFQCEREIGIGSRKNRQVAAKFLSEGAGEVGIVRGIFDARELDGEGVFQARQQIEGESNSSRAGEMVGEQMSVCGNGFLNQFAEPVEESIIGGFAKIIWRQDDNAIVAEIEDGARQFDGFSQAGSPGPREQAEVGKLFADA